MLTRDAILQAQQLKTETVPASAWGGDVLVSEISAVDRLALLGEIQKLKGTDDERRLDITAMAMLVCRCLVDAEGNRLFADEDAPLLTRKNLGTLTAVYNVAARLNGLSAAVEDDLEKNSEPGPGDSSPSA